MNNLATQYCHAIRELERELGELRRENALLREKLEERDRTIAAMQERITALEEENRKLNGTGKKLRRIIFKENKREDTTNGPMRRRGARMGHVGHIRRKPKDEEITEEREVRLSRCPHCEAPIDNEKLQGWTERTVTDIHFLRHTHDAADEGSDEARWFHAQMTWFFRKARRKHRRCRSPDARRILHAQMLRALERYWREKTYDDPAVETAKRWWLEDRGAQLLTFLQYDNVPWHNNAAERAIRPLVTRRKICGGSRSERGAEREAINMSCVTTIFRQGKSLFEEVPRLFRAGLMGRATPAAP